MTLNHRARVFTMAVLAAALMLALWAIPALAAEPTSWEEVSTETALSNALKQSSSADNPRGIKLNKNISVDHTLTIPQGAAVFLDLNGYEIYRAPGSSGAAIRVDGELTVLDGDPTANKHNRVAYTDAVKSQYGAVKGGVIVGYKGDPTNPSIILVEDGGRLTLNGGTLCNNQGSTGGVTVRSTGAFTMNGGAICGNSTSEYGGVLVEGAFTMNGGAICGNSTNGYGGGVFIKDGGTFTMNGGAIRGNVAAISGGGVFIESGGTLTMNDGSVISGNACFLHNGGGAHVVGTLVMNGGSRISGNKAATEAGGGAYVTGTLVMNPGSEISGNGAYRTGGGAFIYTGGKLTMNGGGGISGNTASERGGGVFIDKGATLAMNGGGSISGNKAGERGGGVCVSHEDNATLTVSGGATVTGNSATSGDRADNVCLEKVASGVRPILATGALTGKIGVSVLYLNGNSASYINGQFARGSGYALSWKDAAAFDSDCADYVAGLTDNLDEYVMILGKPFDVSAIPAQTYNGTALTPEVVATQNGSLMSANNYDVRLPDGECRDAGEYTVLVLGKNNTNNLSTAGTHVMTFTVNPATVTVPGVSVKDKTYDGTTAAEVDAAGVTIEKFGDDDVRLAAVGAFEDANAGENKVVNIRLTLEGAQKHNYALALDSQQSAASIARRPLTVTANALKKTQGAADPALTYSTEGLVEGDALSGSLARAEGEAPGEYDITQGTLSAGDNYILSFVGAKLTIEAQPDPGPGPGPGPGPEPEPQPQPEEGPAAPLLAAMTVASSDAMEIAWTERRDANSYEVYLGGELVFSCGGGCLSCTVDGLTPGEFYEATVRAYRDGSLLDESPVMAAYAGNGSKKATNPGAITVSKDAVTLRPGKSAKVKAKITPAVKGWRLDKRGKQLRYLSGNPAVATVNDKGSISAVGSGECKIYVQTINGLWASVTVTVDMQPKKVTLRGGTKAIDADSTLDLGGAVKLSPANSVTKLRWTSSDEAIATVDASGVVTGVGEGTATITVTAENDKAASRKVKVHALPKKITFARGDKTVGVEGTLDLSGRVVLTPADTITELTWASSNPEVATVSAGGVVTGVTAGKTEISVTASNGKTAKLRITVK